MVSNEILKESTLQIIIDIAKQAGQAIMQVYESDDFDIDINVKTKSDDSPLTRADMAAHNVIVKHLQENFPDTPCLSEESEGITFEERKNWGTCFIIDPLDGTKEFIARNDDFTVNIGLIENGKVILGVIYLPVFDTTYYAAKGMGAYKQDKTNQAEAIRVRKIPEKNGEKHFSLMGSRRHGLDKLEKLCQNLPHYELSSRGSSLKMCMVAEGKADLYPRLAPTSEWDTAASQIIVEEAGGRLVQLDFSDLTYNQKESILNPFFLVLGDPEFDWRNELIIPE